VNLFFLLDLFSRINTSRKQGGLGKMNIPLLADKNLEISSKYLNKIFLHKLIEFWYLVKYGVLKEDEGIAFRGLFIIDFNGILRQITINDLPVGRSVDETLRLVQAFQFTDKHGEGRFLIFKKIFHFCF
jgi:alkyl hydroperoxide reductase subunit AhpC